MFSGRYISDTFGRRALFWIPVGTLPDSALIVFARDDDYTFGVLQSRPHSLWALGTGTQVREKESGFRYTPTSTFETFPFPQPTASQADSISTAARRLHELRDGWLHAEPAPRSLTSLYSESPTWLTQAHERLDRDVLDAYGWPQDISDGDVLAGLLELNLRREAVPGARDDQVGPGT